MKEMKQPSREVRLTFGQTMAALKKEGSFISKNALEWVAKLQHDVNVLMDRVDNKYIESLAKETAQIFIEKQINPMPLTNLHGKVVSIRWMAKQVALQLLADKPRLNELAKQNDLKITVQKLLPSPDNKGEELPLKEGKDEARKKIGHLVYIPWEVDNLENVNYDLKDFIER